MASPMTVFAFLAICIALTVAGPLPNKQGGSGHGQATSYAVVTQHNDKGSGSAKSDGGYSHGGDHYGKSDGHSGHGDDHSADYYSYPKYDFAYGVEDSKTGDIKEQQESRDGDKVQGSYSLKESDGTTRLVTYTSDKKSGFEATVHKIGQANAGIEYKYGH
ncbi:adult-specific cuticular protein ACP-20-like [Musca domestica]|uniref:Adult-specific cuticular protein ACP-20-like n=1 Tax=Musca domestica TaxID=7370 RepID=A0ABM3URN2_MUSDO|nr:adult-specific cuticular protein ACP-20-like [Musca domestica]